MSSIYTPSWFVRLNLIEHRLCRCSQIRRPVLPGSAMNVPRNCLPPYVWLGPHSHSGPVDDASNRPCLQTDSVCVTGCTGGVCAGSAHRTAEPGAGLDEVTNLCCFVTTQISDIRACFIEIAQCLDLKVPTGGITSPMGSKYDEAPSQQPVSA